MRFNEIGVGRFARGLQKLFSIKGPVPTPVLSSEIQPVHRLFSGTENAYLEGWSRFGLAAQIAASVGNTNGTRLRNPVASNVIAVIEKLSYVCGVAATTILPLILLQGVASVDLTTVFSPIVGRLDARGLQSPTIIPSTQANPPAIGSNRGLAAVAANVQFEFINTVDQELLLLPGDILQINTGNVNEADVFWALWRERFLEESERT